MLRLTDPVGSALQRPDSTPDGQSLAARLGRSSDPPAFRQGHSGNDPHRADLGMAFVGLAGE